MTTDDFTTAARAEAERLVAASPTGRVFPTPFGVHIAEWARTYLAEQEASEEEVEDAYEAFISHNGPARELNEFRERCCVECGDAVSWPGKKPDGGKRDRLHGMRAALAAARAVGRDAR